MRAPARIKPESFLELELLSEIEKLDIHSSRFEGDVDNNEPDEFVLDYNNYTPDKRIIHGRKVINAFEKKIKMIPADRKFKKRDIDFHYLDNTNYCMKIKHLPEPYCRLAMLRATEPDTTENSQILDSFMPHKTPEGDDFWWELLGYGLPSIPLASMRELDNEFVSPNIY
jgi:hypothetical protein